MKFYKGLVFICVILGLFIISGCIEEIETTKEQPEKASAVVEEQSQEEIIQDVGSFQVMYAPVINPDYNELQQIFEDRELFETIADSLNSFLVLPSDIPIVFGECGEMNAYYDPENSQIVMCYELIEYFAQLFSDYTESEEELDKAVLDTTFFVFYHEMGHSLIDILELPTTGKEEDAVDQLATIILIGGSEEGEEAVLNGAVLFFLSGVQADIEQLAFWDEHSLDMQRFYNLVCWVYGKNPGGYSYLVEEGYLPEERAVRCPSEYEQMLNSWDVLLSPYVKGW